MIVKFGLYLFLFQFVVSQVIYDAYFGKPIKDDRNKQLQSLNLTGPCTIKVEPCQKEEGRRIDGTCTNPKYPSRGGSPTPLLRMRPAKFGLGNTLRPAMNGSELPSSRLLRTKILSDGFPEDHEFNTLATHVFVFSTVDVADLTVLLRYAVVSDCCLGNRPNRVNPLCIPIPVTQDDPYLRRTGIRCMNLTRFSTYQEMGCIPNSLPAERYNLPTPVQDLSIVYGYSDLRERQIRTYQGGLLKSEMKDGVERPPGTSAICINNRRPVENACYEFGKQLFSVTIKCNICIYTCLGDFYDGNVLSGIYLTAMWFYREHNRLARKLAMINPCWDDQELFETARKINIAQWQYILYYELMSDILGRKNAIETGVLYETNGYVNDFDERHKPGVYHEYLIGTRWFHTFQDGRTDLYSRKGKYLGTRTTVDDEFRSGILEVNNTEADLTQGAFRQRAAKFDYTIEPDLAERVLGELQSASDLSAIDIMRGRDQGLPPYNEYRKICGMPVAHKFKDFEDAIYADVCFRSFLSLLPGRQISKKNNDDKTNEAYLENNEAGTYLYPSDVFVLQKVEQLRRIYDDEVDDMELMVAIYSERLLHGAWVGPTLFCIMVENLVNWRKSDRFFFEHGDTHAALTLPQLNEVRQASMARILCDNGDGVEKIQPKAMLNVSKKNKITPCEHIPSIDLQKWVDPKCYEGKKNPYLPEDYWSTGYNVPWSGQLYDYKK
ncbi:peroxidase-like [Trichoplusia ni]|uniref:Peroxidase-like n=1 Tax=Trichoplusia ni TaxID=7111 RepID=A0A7E5WEZ4_TRINI|nr:peroxidase-like [Trichoplusia ni]